MPLNQTSMQIIHLLKANDLEGVRKAFRDHPEEINAHSGIAGGTLLHQAAGKSSPEMVRLLVGLGFDVNLPSATRGDLPIDSAAADANIENVRLLIALGSHLDVSEPQRNPLLAAITAGRGRSEDDVIIRAPEVAEVLLRAGLDHGKQSRSRAARAPTPRRRPRIGARSQSGISSWPGSAPRKPAVRPNFRWRLSFTRPCRLMTCRPCVPFAKPIRSGLLME